MSLTFWWCSSLDLLGRLEEGLVDLLELLDGAHAENLDEAGQLAGGLLLDALLLVGHVADEAAEDLLNHLDLVGDLGVRGRGQEFLFAVHEEALLVHVPVGSVDHVRLALLRVAGLLDAADDGAGLDEHEGLAGTNGTVRDYGSRRLT